jgi:hypothetical protein
MQGFFIHVSDGSYPVASTLIFTNGIRVNNLSPSFHKKSTRELRPLLRINARNDIEGAYGDPTVIYFSKDASPMFDTHFDALKMMNTEVVVPNFYSVLQDSSRLSVSGIPYPVDSITEVKLGLQTNIDGPVTFQISDVECMPPGLYIYFCDHVTGIKQNISLHPEYTINLTQGFYDNRFSVIFSLKDLRYQPRNDEMFYIYSFRNRLYIYSKLDFGKNADITICNMLGQRLFHQTISVNGYLEMDVNYPTGVYIVCLSSGEAVMNKKVYFYNQ